LNSQTVPPPDTHVLDIAAARKPGIAQPTAPVKQSAGSSQKL
jgi:hypothetical protein